MTDTRVDPTSRTQWEVQMELVTAAFADEHPFGEMIVHVGDTELKTAVAESPEQMAMGMVSRTYDKWDAMLFVQESPRAVTFHNFGVPQETHVATFDSDGVLIEQFTMAANDRTHVTARPHKYALENHGNAGDFASEVKLLLPSW